MSDLSYSTKYYSDAINLTDIEALEGKLQLLLDQTITSVDVLEKWLFQEGKLLDEIVEAMNGHAMDFYRDTTNTEKRNIYLHDQTIIHPLLKKFQAAFDKKFCECPYTLNLDDHKYGLMRKVRSTKLKLFRKENLPLEAREQELGARYSEIMGSLTVEWNGEERSYSFVKAQVDSNDRNVRERAWRKLAIAHKQIKPKINEIMNELINTRTQIAINAGFKNYRDYLFELKNREYSIQDCYHFHQSTENYLIPAWSKLANVFKLELNLDTYRPWDIGPCALQGLPFSSFKELLDGVELMLGKTDSYFQERFRFMRENGLLDIEERNGKSPGAFCEIFPASKNAFIISNFGPSFNAVIALIHEMGHALNEYLQFSNNHVVHDHNRREEVAELYSHSLEFLLMDKLNIFYTKQDEFKNAQRELLHRGFNMLINPIIGDLFQHWLYTNPNHTPEERDSKFFEINKRFMYLPVDTSGLESDIGCSWMNSVHYFKYPFYKIEYAISQLGALQLLEIYRENQAIATSLFKQGAGTYSYQSIAKIYQDTGVSFDFSDQTLKKTARFLDKVISELK